MTIWEFARRGKELRLGVAERSLLLADILRWGTPRDFDPQMPYGARFGIYGVGVVLDQGVVRPSVLTAQDKGFVRGVATPDSALAALLKDFIDAALLEDVLVLPIPVPELHAKPGDSISLPRSGTLGAGVAWAGKEGFITAGHVAYPTGCALKAGGANIGTCIYSNDPAGHGRAEADVAVIETSAGVARKGVVKSTAIAGPTDVVDILRGTTGKSASATMMGMNAWFVFPNSKATCGDVYMTTMAVTKGGDSGAPVFDSVGFLVGHVLGASPGYSSYIQDVHYQLREVARHPGLSGIAVG